MKKNSSKKKLAKKNLVKKKLTKKTSINKTNKTKKTNNNKLKALFLVLLIAAFSGTALFQYSGYLQILSMRDAAVEERRSEEKRRAELLENQKYTNGDEFAAEIARSRLGMLYENEYKVIVE